MSETSIPKQWIKAQSYRDFWAYLMSLFGMAIISIVMFFIFNLKGILAFIFVLIFMWSFAVVMYVLRNVYLEINIKETKKVK